MKILGGTVRDIKKGNRNTGSQEAKFVLSGRDKTNQTYIYVLETNSIRWWITKLIY